MKTPFLLFLAGLLALHISAAAEAPAAGPNDSNPAPDSLTILPKNKSAFVLDRSSRNPFWPIGWKPAAASSNGSGQSSSPMMSPSAFVVTSIAMEQGGRYAIINGKVMSEGQVFGLQVGNQVHQITVKFIQDGQVVLSQQNEEFFVPLRRR